MLRHHGISMEKSKRIHNGIDLSSFSVSEQERADNRKNVKEEFSIPSDDRVITYVGRLSPEKGVIHLLRAFEKEYAENESISLLIVGDGVQRASFEAFQKGCIAGDKIHFAGFRKDIKELLSASDVLVLPSLIETFSLTTLQAFAVGTPVVASDVGGTPEQVLDDFNGLLFKSENDDDLKDKIHKVLSDQSKATRYTQNARTLSETYLNENRMVDEIEKVYTDLIDRL
jgi:glycosyltransferase involved in cell wall biosynthesis